ncbi:transposase [Mycobacterium sp.]|uniref:transposase n=1 Tax=Mycobacterium sp. TaxID=1785 RepID=UPI0039C9215F
MVSLGRTLGERSRFADARALKAYAGSAPITRASGRSLSVTHRRTKNNRLANGGWIWAFSAASNCEPPSALPPATRPRRPSCRRHPKPVKQTPRPALPEPKHSQVLDESRGFPSLIGNPAA